MFAFRHCTSMQESTFGFTAQQVFQLFWEKVKHCKNYPAKWPLDFFGNFFHAFTFTHNLLSVLVFLCPIYLGMDHSRKEISNGREVSVLRSEAWYQISDWDRQPDHQRVNSQLTQLRKQFRHGNRKFQSEQSPQEQRFCDVRFPNNLLKSVKVV